MWCRNKYIHKYIHDLITLRDSSQKRKFQGQTPVKKLKSSFPMDLCSIMLKISIKVKNIFVLVMKIKGGFKGGQRGHGPKPRAFGNQKGPHT